MSGPGRDIHSRGWASDTGTNSGRIGSCLGAFACPICLNVSTDRKLGSG